MSTQIISLETNAQRAPFAIQILFAVLSITAVVLRVVARRKKNLQLQWDDYLIVVALVLALGLIACDMIGMLYCGVGLHVTEVVTRYGPQRLTVFLKVLIPVQILWATSLTATKLSILLFYTRIFNIRPVRLAAQIICTIIFLWCLTVILSAFLLCRPFAFNWDPTIPDGRCGNRVLSYVLTGVLNIITDVLVLCLPIPVIWNLQMRTANKIALSGVFAVGFFVCIVSIIRLKSLLTIDYTDATYSVTLAFVWSMVEPCTGIILSCLPIIKVLLGRPFRSISKPSNESGSKMQTRSRGFSNAKTSTTCSGGLGPGQNLDEHPLTSLTTKSAAASVTTQEINRSRVEDGDSQLGDLEQGKVEADTQGPLDHRRSSSAIQITQQWKVR